VLAKRGAELSGFRHQMNEASVQRLLPSKADNYVVAVTLTVAAYPRYRGVGLLQGINPIAIGDDHGKAPVYLLLH
jgi:hypothetical protein